MKPLTLTPTEIKILTKPEITEEGIRIFFPHGIREDSFIYYRALWDKILDASEVDGKVVQRVHALLPSQGLDIQKVSSLQSYNCFTAASHVLGMPGFEAIMELSTPATGRLTIPLRGISSIDSAGLERAGFTQVPRIEESGSVGLVLLENSMGAHLNHAAAYLGTAEGMDFYFHKPLPCLPDIKPLETILEACSYAEGRRKKAEVRYSFWQMNASTSALVERAAPLVYNVLEKGKRHPRARMVDGYDITPIVLYQDHKAVAVVSKCLYNGGAVALSIYAQAPDGRFGEWHEDPEHGDWPRAVEIQRKRLEELARCNPHMIPKLDVFGKSREEVERVLERKRLFAYHAESSGGDFFENPRKLLNE
ncbi:MAG: hypothetical protein Q7K45_01010 [Nanoarchaeota archaeon]|nr:hypothetical protein [Nanoarchaeota archaeon]